MTGASSREKAYLERKIVTLEQRLVLVERFVEMRFCETFRDFSIRNLPDSTNLNEKLVTATKRVTITPQRDEGNHSSENVEPLSDSSPPPPQHEQDEDQESLRSYRTRSGRKTKRLTVTALGAISSPGGKGSPSKSIPLSSDDAKDTPNPRGKILRVSVTRLDKQSIKDKGAATIEVDSSEVDVRVVKVDETGQEDEELDDEDYSGDYEATLENDDDPGDDGKYITFPTGQEDGEGIGTGDVDEEDQMEESVARNSDDGDWNASAEEDDDEDDDDDDFEETDKMVSTSTSKKWKMSTTAKKGKSTKKRKSYHVPSRLELLPEGIKLQMNPDKIQLRECPICHHHQKPETFEHHVQSHVKEKNRKCAFCEKRFSSRQKLATHQRIHQVDKYGRKCRLCDKIFITRIKLLYHERICIRKRLEEEKHVDPAVIQDVRERSQNVELNWPDSTEKIPKGKKKCIHCKALVKEEDFMAHLREFHANWKCNFCENTFVHKSGLVRHLCRTHGNNCVTCELCQKTFESRAELRGHNAKCQEEHKRKVAKVLTDEIIKTGKINSSPEEKADDEEKEKGGDGEEETRMNTSREADTLQPPVGVDHHEDQISLELPQQ